MKFRKKPVVIEAVQWTGNNWDEVKQFAKLDILGVDEKGWLDWTELFDKTKVVAVTIISMEGKVFVTVGNWIIRGYLTKRMRK